ncbi:hypothetical protein YDYSY3_38840 [Paenibacillus chitinolyticus]|uniref:type II toxin-antitoxin system HicB family antitoxin n=1 Tax=Paenibacillus chitinolyticus TaxID=79263 RepID=UPI0026E4B731|nr:type II toxin-antitoxin system HicB family antitoxin [Paenibacillus chitinolyticus]GKS12884.1 hypothetical protein YDYSY3_38840 [Paenibacillus chitinolyticus]
MSTVNTNTIELQILFEEDKNEGNFSAYIPAIRLGAMGDTLEEARKNAMDLVEIQLQTARTNGDDLPRDTAIIETIRFDLIGS